MAHILFHNGLGTGTVPAGTNCNEDLGEKILEFDFDPAVTRVSSLKLSDDGTSVVVRFEGKTLQEQDELLTAEAKAESMSMLKEIKRRRIKSLIADIIEPIEWKEERAKELDAAAGNNNKRLAVAQYRKAARDANNAHEVLLDACSTIEEVEAFDPDWTPAFKAANSINF
tara:strand:+ start:4584 stop:5093 length:510 start_codon:yes stop_codon:yes gene_type:complete